MENCKETNIVSIVDVDEVNCDVLNLSLCKDVSMLLESIEEDFILNTCVPSNTSNCEDRVEEEISLWLLNSSLMDKFGCIMTVFYHLKGAKQLTMLFQRGSQKLACEIFSGFSVQWVDKQG
ncbi:hypothetical protein M9H77_20805 [Catharanthus roseus]|uniref:Uncharacterized protein n=1 Tax=Catharanthus roseus TaxID=4058 RepID=A0ACC0AKJ3_CATRO|nr:hypothetical protein M9H77_20805 [Catharanthus roseus]